MCLYIVHKAANLNNNELHLCMTYSNGIEVYDRLQIERAFQLSLFK